jgi:serine/threonine protein kinase
MRQSKPKIAKTKKPSAPTLGFKDTPQLPPPLFDDLLRHPKASGPLPSDFSVEKEAEHIVKLWERSPDLQGYKFIEFVSSGGSGMVFKVQRIGLIPFEAMKIARRRLVDKTDLPTGAAEGLSPVSESELSALEQISHPNVVRLFKTINIGGSVVAISTSFVEEPANLDDYLRVTLEKAPKKGPHPFSPVRLENACIFLLERCQEIASALAHMHSMQMFHFDLKPANILVSKASKIAMLTDMGSCVHARRLAPGEKMRVHFTWTYAHPELQDTIHNPASISGGGLKASSEVGNEQLAKYDLYAFGKTLQQSLAVLDAEFEERCYSSYSFRFLHLIACLLLDGHNSPASLDSHSRISSKDGLAFVSDCALNYPARLFAEHKIATAAELVERLRRHSREYSWSASVPEMDAWQADFINTGTDRNAPFTKRVKAIFNHPAVRRLKLEPQLGWASEVYPSATHTRWAHTLGAFDSLVSMYTALLADPEVPTLRVLADRIDIEHALVAVTLHDLGQTAFGHDWEATSPFPNHEAFVPRLLDEPMWGKALRTAIKDVWPSIDISRVLNILRIPTTAIGTRSQPTGEGRPIDGVASDLINGAIDADKLDYLFRDSVACGVPYGMGMDRDRLVRALTVSAHAGADGGCRLALAYKGKGRPAVESMLVARYQMYLAVYWHHAVRVIHAMFGHAVIATFTNKGSNDLYRKATLSTGQINELFYYRIVCRQQWAMAITTVFGRRAAPQFLNEEPPPTVAADATLEFVWRFAEDPIRALLARQAIRDLYKRVFDFRLGDLGERADYSGMRIEFIGNDRIRHAREIQKQLLEKIDSRTREHGVKATTQSESAARQRLQELTQVSMPLIVIDFPTRGLPSESNFPVEIGDPHRKYFGMQPHAETHGATVFGEVRQLQIRNAAVRVFAADELHELVVRYLNAEDVRACVGESISVLKR